MYIIEIDFQESGTFIDDYTAIYTLNSIGEKYKKYNKQVIISHLDFKSK